MCTKGEGYVYLSSVNDKRFTIAHLDGSSAYFSRVGIVAAAAPSIVIESMPSLLGLGVSTFNLRIAGCGPIAFSTRFPLCKIELKKEESIIVDPKGLVLWESSIEVDHTKIPIRIRDNKEYKVISYVSSAILSTPVKYIRKLPARVTPGIIPVHPIMYMCVKKISSFVRMTLCSLGCVAKKLMGSILTFIKLNMYGYPENGYIMKGPGSLYIQTATESRKLAKRIK